VSGPVRPPLTVEESDGSVVVRPANTIKFNAADFTVAKSGNEATISIDSTGTGAALTDTQVGFGNSSNLLTGSSLFTYDEP
jgi:azurin